MNDTDDKIGKRLVYSVMHLDSDDNVINLHQNVGIITKIDEGQLTVTHDDGTHFTLPPETDLETFPLGAIVTLKDGRKIESPDYGVRWRVYPPDSEGQ